MDYSKIRLNNERSTHVVKRLNRLGTWGFFKVLNRESFRIMGFSMLMIICIAPIFAVQLISSFKLTELKQTMPFLNGFGFSTGVWENVNSYYTQQVFNHNVLWGLFTVAAALLTCLIFSGGFAVMRDSFWTGKLSTVGIFKSFGMGIAANAPYAIVSTVVTALGVYGITVLYSWIANTVAVWLAIVLTVVASIAMLILACYLMILCSVAVTYKQSVAENMDDSWRLLWLNFFPNIVHLLLALLPIPLYFVFSTGILQTFYLIVLVMYGGAYFPLVWHSFMMRTFALFHPVEARKKKDVEAEIREREQEQARIRMEAERAAAEKRDARRAAKRSKKEKLIKDNIDDSVTTDDTKKE